MTACNKKHNYSEENNSLKQTTGRQSKVTLFSCETYKNISRLITNAYMKCFSMFFILIALYILDVRMFI